MIVKSLPSLFTLGNLFLGMIALILAFEGEVGYASIMVIIGMFLDGLDGRVARMLNAQSEFGKELDSLSDVISFGVAPAFIMYEVLLHELGIGGILLTGLFPMCGALRLARFNSQKTAPNYFVGLPITAAGGVLATFALYKESMGDWVLITGMLVLSYLMVSNIKYPNFKKLGLPRHSLWVIPILLGVIIIIAFLYRTHFPKIIFIPLGIYALFGLYRGWRTILRGRFRKGPDMKEARKKY